MAVTDHDQVDIQFACQAADFVDRLTCHQVAFGADATPG